MEHERQCDDRDMVANPKVYLSVVIRTRNSAKTLAQVLEALAAQRCTFSWEIIIVDNESQDETLELCQRYKARIVSIRTNEYSHGRALNVGISNARGELVLLCSAHSVPIGSHFFENAVAPFADPAMAAVRCLSGNLKEQTVQWYTAHDIQYTSEEEQKAAEASTAWIMNYPSATCCVIRRSVWEKLPYDEDIESLEDKIWASQILRHGYKIRCCVESVFIHNRQEKKWRYSWAKQNRQYKALYRATGYVPLTWSYFIIRLLRWTLVDCSKSFLTN